VYVWVVYEHAIECGYAAVDCDMAVLYGLEDFCWVWFG